MRLRAAAIPAAALAFIILGLVLRGAYPTLGRAIWLTGLALTGLPVVSATIRGVLARRFAADLVASLAIVVALVLGEPLPGLIVVLMQTGGEALETYARGRASDAVRDLEAAAPTIAHRVCAGGIVDVPADEIQPGETILVRPGELIPCDGFVIEGHSQVDAAQLTGEPVPISGAPGTRLLSGSRNLEGPLTLRVLAAARESQYARIVELVRSAQASKAPIQRLADRYAVWFTPITLLVCGLAWATSRDPARVLAVLVVATPCPLILAAPVAIVGGINRAARRGVIIRHGTALEQLGGVTTAVFDKTGTLTIGRPAVSRVIPVAPFTEDDVLRLAGAVEHGSGHLLARTLVEEALRRGISIPTARSVVEAAGQGVAGDVNGTNVAVGALPFVTAHASADGARPLTPVPGEGLRAYVTVDGRTAGVVEYADAVRPNAPALIERLRRLGVRRMLLLSGDAADNAAEVASAVGLQEFRGDLLPEDKVDTVRGLVGKGERVVMLGDGTNDAPALGVATVGVALASGGGGITAEAADAVILGDDPGRLADAVEISRRTMRIARQSIWVGLGLSGAAMAAAALGYVPPTVGALLQEVIDVAVILNALRAAA
ncbi:MAG TPA: heavy metal translocating P-type ATPase [Gemmatimonadales bacterium]|nr:heavy metal translocating P-type ATPase [Gemmatimonadales bacterium]